jgi:hypothetical protein
MALCSNGGAKRSRVQFRLGAVVLFKVPEVPVEPSSLRAHAVMSKIYSPVQAKNASFAIAPEPTIAGQMILT